MFKLFSAIKSFLTKYISNIRNFNFKSYKGMLTVLIGVTLLLGIWVITDTLKYLSYQNRQKTHNSVNFKKEKVRIVQKGDFITGKSIPLTQVKVNFTPGTSKATLKTDSSGTWSYKVPSNIGDGKYRLTVFGNNSGDNLALIKSYKVRIVSSREIYKLQKQIKLPRFLVNR